MDIALDGLSVMIGIPAGRAPNWETVHSLLATIRACDRIALAAEVAVVQSGIVTRARDDVLDAFLASDSNRLFWIDSDMEWEPSQFFRLLALSTKVDVLGAPYPAKLSTPTYYLRFDQSHDIELSEYGLMEVDGMGLGFTVMRREVVERVALTKPVMLDECSGKTVKSVFRTDIADGKFRGEDMAFFADVRALGYKVWLDPMVDLPHHGSQRYVGRFLDALTPVANGDTACTERC